MSVSKLVLSLIADELGIEILDTKSTTRFDEIGLDSMLAVSVVSQLQHAGLYLPLSVFWDFSTIRELEAFLQGS